MGILSVSLTFVGYVLVYASVANGGKFALSPWTGIFQDAYSGESTPTDTPTATTPPTLNLGK